MRLVNEEDWKRFVNDLSEKVDVIKLMEARDHALKESKDGTDLLFKVWYDVIRNGELYLRCYLTTYMSKSRCRFLSWLSQEKAVFPCRTYNGYRWVKGYRDGHLKVLQITEDITDATPIPDKTVDDWLKEYKNMISEKPEVMTSCGEWFLCSSAMVEACRGFYPESLWYLFSIVVEELSLRESH